MAASGVTVIGTSLVTEPASFVTVNRYVRVEGGETASEPVTATGVTTPEVRSVIEALVPPVLDHERVELVPAQMVEADAEKVLIVGG
jgi:hypothetical protein